MPAVATVENDERALKHANSIFGDILLSKLEPRHLEELKEFRLQKDRVSRTTVNMDLKAIKASMEWAINWGYLKASPFERVRLLRVDKQLPIVLSQSDFDAILEFLPSQELKILCKFAVSTGLRRGELVYLLRKDVDFDERLVLVQSSEYYRVKHGKSRVVPFSPHVLSLIRNLERADPFLFNSPDARPFHEDYVTKTFKKAVRLAGLSEEISFHSLRSTCASRLAAAGATALQIKEILGHAFVKTSEAYTRIPPQSLRAFVDAIPPV